MESCRTDYSSHTFKLQTPDAEMDLYAYFHDLGERILPTGEAFEVSKGQHFGQYFETLIVNTVYECRDVANKSL